MRAKLKQVNSELKRHQHLPVPEHGRRLASVVRGHLTYSPCQAIPTLWTFYRQVAHCWMRVLRRRSQQHLLTCQRMGHIARWALSVRIVHPQPSLGFDARTYGKSPLR